MRTNLYELLSQQQFDATKEYERLWTLFFEEKAIYSHYVRYTLQEFIDEKYFRQLPFRGSFSSIDDLMDALGLSLRTRVSIDPLLLFCELLIALLPDVDTKMVPAFGAQKRTILGNIYHILERTNHETCHDREGREIIVEKNKQVTLAAELVTDPTIAFDLIEYNHFALKGHLAEKKQLLASIATYIEPILKSNALQNNGYKQLQSDAGFAFNNFHIRHNNKEGTKRKEYIATLSDRELEDLYDKSYEIAISVIIINDYLQISSEIKSIKDKVQGGSD